VCVSLCVCVCVCAISGFEIHGIFLFFRQLVDFLKHCGVNSTESTCISKSLDQSVQWQKAVLSVCGDIVSANIFAMTFLEWKKTNNMKESQRKKKTEHRFRRCYLFLLLTKRRERVEPLVHRVGRHLSPISGTIIHPVVFMAFDQAINK